MSLEIKIFPKGPLQENTYLVKDISTGLCAVIDPGYIGPDVISELGESSNLKYVILTHGHYDHFYSAPNYIKEFPDSKFVASDKDRFLMNKDWGKELMARGWNSPQCPPADIYVNEGDTLEFGKYHFGFIHTPGHTEGGMCITIEKMLFSGDTLFRLSVGNTSFETGNWDELVKSVNNKLYTLPEDTIVYPGHGPATEIAFEKRSNPFV